MNWKPSSLQDLQKIEWVEGKRIEFEPSSYRHRQVIECVADRPFTALFSNGQKSYMAYWELIRSDGSWNKAGINIIPILPDGRVLMIVEQRGPLGRFMEDIPRELKLSNGKIVDLRQFGKHSSLEFPGGGIEKRETITIGALKELAAETGIPRQIGALFRSSHLVFPFGCDLAHGNYIGAVYLSSLEFANHVKNDGGLNILALTPEEIELNIRNGVFCSMNAGLGMWYWYLNSVVQIHAEYLNPITNTLPVNRPDLIIERVVVK